MAKKILVVEDEDTTKDLLKVSLEMNGYEVVLVEDGFCALGLYRHGEKFDLIITDLRMPGMTGIQLIQKIRDINAKQTFVAMSGNFTENAIEWLSEQEIRLLKKPFAIPALRVVVSRALSSQPD